MNHLSKEKSPYLLQHANNPVDWYPWSEEAFSKAEKEKKPIFLSIGYSTCHWCHVMAHESFENKDVAKQLNSVFICIKVDREERPDIDSIYMTACSMLTGSGGWPLTIIMTPDKKPFFAGTYFPKKTQPGRIGMLELPEKINQIWTNRQQEVLDSAESIVEALQRNAADTSGAILPQEILSKAYDHFSKLHDQMYGGFGKAPKFPSPHNLIFLLRYWKRTENSNALAMVEKTLSAMRLGGMYDHIGFGFHRYSTDQQWILPHFEKMLYDQAMLALAYTEAYQATGNILFKSTVKEMFSYIKREMTDNSGGFFSAEDADSEGVEGKFYVWTAEQLRALLNQDDTDLVMKIYNAANEGNFTEEASGRKTGVNILYLRKNISDTAIELSIPFIELQNRLEYIRKILFNARKQRIHPHKDDKILTDWNGLMIAAMAKGSVVLADASYLNTAKKAADFLLNTMKTEKGRILHRYRDGEISVQGMLDDYAFLIWGLIELYEAGFESIYLREALKFSKIMQKYFWDQDSGGFFHTPTDGEKLLLRQKDIYDGAIPSGNSVALTNFMRLARLTGNAELEETAIGLQKAFTKSIEENPWGYGHYLLGVDYFHNPSIEIVIVGDPKSDDFLSMVKELRKIYAPNTMFLFKNSIDNLDESTSLAPFTADYSCINGKATAYVCSGFNCKLPTTDINEAIRLVSM